MFDFKMYFHKRPLISVFLVIQSHQKKNYYWMESVLWSSSVDQTDSKYKVQKNTGPVVQS